MGRDSHKMYKFVATFSDLFCVDSLYITYRVITEIHKHNTAI